MSQQHTIPGLLSCLYVCERDTARVAPFLQANESLASVCQRMVAVYGYDASERSVELDAWSVHAPDLYELLPVKTYAMLQHALQDHSWSYLLKVDVDTKVNVIEVARAIDDGVKYAGKTIGKAEACDTAWHFGKCRYKVYEEPCSVDLFPSQQVGLAAGPAYLLHRDAAQAVVDKGVRFAMRHIFEDVMVGQALEDIYPVAHYPFVLD